jgi:membrane-associated PAP2 superfamily phosphatase
VAMKSARLLGKKQPTRPVITSGKQDTGVCFVAVYESSGLVFPLLFFCHISIRPRIRDRKNDIKTQGTWKGP